MTPASPSSSVNSDASVVDVLAQGLAQAGCRHAFGIPGGEVVHLIDALVRAGLQFHLVRHETGGGFMAEGTFYRSGAPGVLVATIGPGVANAVCAIANAQQERVPLLLLTGCHDDEVTSRYTHQIFDHQAVLAPLVKGTFRLTPGSAAVTVRRALQRAQTGRPGPVHLDIPVSMAPQAATGPDVVVAMPATTVADARAVDAAATALRDAKRPLILAGVDAANEGAEGALRSLTERLGAPVLTSYKGKGLLEEDHPLSLGAAGLSPTADTVLLPVVREADVVLLAGYDPIEMRQPWCSPFSPHCTVIDVSPVANDHYVHPATHMLVGSATENLRALAEALPAAAPTAQHDTVSRLRAALTDAFSSDSDSSPGAYCQAAQRAVPEDAVVTVDTGAHRIVLSQLWRSTAPRRMLQSSGLATMGPAVPLAVGAKLVEPHRPVVAFIGDAGLEMFLGELATVRDMGLAFPIVVFDDQSLALIEKKQRALGLPEAGVNSGGTDFVAVANALGGHGVRVESAADLERALKEALTAKRFTILQCMVARRSYDQVL